ncbi:MAG TPA: PQQ-dependent sugar dehydrogenase [Nitrososphaera sp.]|nr:PQQ-dependent sugar dehydrogenase [Nitrososphaera sp.]
MGGLHSTWPVVAAVAGSIIVIVLVLGVYGNFWTEPPDGNGNGNPIPDGNVTDDGGRSGFSVLPDSDPPVIRDDALRVEKVIEGLDSPTSMAFLGLDDVLVLEKNSGEVRLISDGKLQNNPVLTLSINNINERGLLGIALDKGSNETVRSVFLYYTEQDGEPRNRVYKYIWDPDTGLTDESLILDLPGTPGPNHDGGKVTIGPDGLLYAVIGDLNRNGMLQNFANGNAPDDTGVIMRVDSSGRAASGSVLSDLDQNTAESLVRYHAYGIRNSFGIDFDPVTGTLWDTENGPSGYDEINLASSGFNSGWETVMGPIGRTNANENDLVMFNGAHYSDPEFSWRSSQGLTDIEFLESSSLGAAYEHNLFVGDFNNGNLYYFTLNSERDSLSFGGSPSSENLADLVADNSEESGAVTFGSGFGRITDIETGPDGNLYVLTFDGDIYRIVPGT